MKRMMFVSVVMITVFTCFPLGVCQALHDNESLKNGGAWQPAEMNVGPDRSTSDKKIDKMLDKSFKKTEIIIPPLESEQTKESDSEVNDKETGDKVEKRD